MGKYVYNPDRQTMERPRMNQGRGFSNDPSGRTNSGFTSMSGPGRTIQDDLEMERANDRLAQQMGRKPLTDGYASKRGRAGQRTNVPPQAMQNQPARNTLQYDPSDVERAGEMAKLSRHLASNPNDTQSMDKLVKIYNDSGLSSRQDAFVGKVNPENGAITFLTETGEPLKGQATADDFGNMAKYVQQIVNPEYQQMVEQQNAPVYGKDQMSMSNTLRDDFRAENKDFDKIASSWNRIKGAQETGAGDIATIFSYMRMLDPASTVREGEFATAEQSAGVPAQITNMYNKLLTGERLTPEQRGSFKSQAGEYWNQALKGHESRKGDYSQRASDARLNPSHVVGSEQYQIYGPVNAVSEQASSNGTLAPEQQARLQELRAWKAKQQQPATSNIAPRMRQQR